MKYSLFVCLYFFVIGSIFAENNLITIIPKEATSWNDTSVEKKNEEKSSKYVYRIVSINISDLVNEPPYLLSECLVQFLEDNKNVSSDDISSMLNSDKKFILHKYLPWGIELSSYKKISVKDRVIGEVSFGSGNDGLLVSGSFVYKLLFMDNNMIYTFWLNYSLTKQEMDILALLPQIFKKKNGLWYWNSIDSLKELYLLLENKDSRLPEEFLRLHDIWDSIISEFRINGIKIIVN